MRLLLLATLACPFLEGENERAWSAKDSYAEFEARVLGLVPAGGVFRGLDGTLWVEDGVVYIDAEIAVERLEGLSERERQWALGPEFFDAARHPRIRFRSDPMRCEELREGGRLPGRLVIRGIDRPVRFDLMPPQCGRPGIDCPIEARGVIRRHSFALGRGAVALGDRVALRLSIRFTASASED